MQGVPDSPRLVAGEILPADPAERPTGASPRDIASPELDPAPSFQGFGSVERARKKAGPLLFWSTAALAAFLVFWVSGGHRLIMEPLTAKVRNSPAQALLIEDVTSRIERGEGRLHLLVDGAARNRGSEPIALPPIVIAVAETNGRTVRYNLGTNQAVLAPGERYGFSSRLDAPTNGVASVSITFQEGSR